MNAGDDHLKPAVAPVSEVLAKCRRAFWLLFGLCVTLEVLSLAPIIYIWNVFDRVLSSRSIVTLISLASLIIGIYVFWSALEWIRSRLMVRLSMRIDWELASDIFDASFRRVAGHKAVNVQQAMGDLLELRQFLSGQGVLAVVAAPFALLFIAAGAVFHPFVAAFALITTLLMLIVAKANQHLTTSALKASNDAKDEAIRLAAMVLRHSETTRAGHDAGDAPSLAPAAPEVRRVSGQCVRRRRQWQWPHEVPATHFWLAGHDARGLSGDPGSDHRRHGDGREHADPQSGVAAATADFSLAIDRQGTPVL